MGQMTDEIRSSQSRIFLQHSCNAFMHIQSDICQVQWSTCLGHNIDILESDEVFVKRTLPLRKG